MRVFVENIRVWLVQICGSLAKPLGALTIRKAQQSRFMALMQRLRHVRSTGPYTRDEMNQR